MTEKLISLIESFSGLIFNRHIDYIYGGETASGHIQKRNPNWDTFNLEYLGGKITIGPFHRIILSGNIENIILPFTALLLYESLEYDYVDAPISDVFQIVSTQGIVNHGEKDPVILNFIDQINAKWQTLLLLI